MQISHCLAVLQLPATVRRIDTTVDQKSLVARTIRRYQLMFAQLCRTLFLLVLGVPALAQAPRTWPLSAQPTLVLGGEKETSGFLSNVTGATRMSDGSVMVGDLGDHALRLYSAKGVLQRAFGRKGAGPGEIGYLARMFRCGDSVYTFDIEHGPRVSVFTLDGRYVRVFRFAAPLGESSPYASACNAAGVFVHHGWGNRTGVRPGLHRSMVPLWLTGADSVLRRVVDSIPGSERWGQTRGGKLVGTRPLPLGRQPVIGIGRNRVYAGSADQYAISVFDLQGRSLPPLQRAVAPRPVVKADVDAVIDEQVAGRSDEVRKRVAESIEQITLPKTLPPYSHLVIDREDHVWVRAYASGGAAQAIWSVFSPTGQLVAEVKAPAALEIYEIGRDYLLGRFVDADVGTPEVRLYTLTRSPGAAR